MLYSCSDVTAATLQASLGSQLNYLLEEISCRTKRIDPSNSGLRASPVTLTSTATTASALNQLIPCASALLNNGNALELSLGAINADRKLNELALAARLEQDANNEKNRMIQEYLSLTLAINAMKSEKDRDTDTDRSTESDCSAQPEDEANQHATSERSQIASNLDCKTPEQVFYTLNVLGSTLRSKADPYIDASVYRDPGTQRAVRGGICELFPDKLYRMLCELEAEGRSDIVSFMPHGRSFMVHKMDVFLKDILPRYFSEQSKWSSFSRQLNLYGFLRVSSGPETGAYYHELFLRGHPNLCHYMRRVGAPKGNDRRRVKLPEGKDPNFYTIPMKGQQK